MAYSKVSTQSVETLIRAYKELAQELQTLEKGKGDKKKINDMVKQLQEKGKKIETTLNQGIDSIYSAAKKHFLTVNKGLVQAELTIKNARAAVDRFSSSLDSEEIKLVGSAPTTLRALLKKLQEDAQDLESSWDDYQSFNPVKKGLDDQYAKTFSQTRTSLINGTKASANNIERLKLMVEEAETQVKEISTLAKQSSNLLYEARTDASEIAEKLTTALSTGAKSLQQVTNNCLGITNFAQQTTCSAEQFRTSQSLMKNAISLDRTLRDEWKALTKILESAKRGAKDFMEDKTIIKSLATAEQCLKELAAHSDSSRKLIADTTKDLATVGKKVQ